MEKKKKDKKILGIILFIIGLSISLSFGYIIIMIMVLLKPVYVLYNLPFLLLPFLIGIILLIYGIYSIKERKNKAILPILRGIFILLIFLYILLSFILLRFSLCN